MQSLADAMMKALQDGYSVCFYPVLTDGIAYRVKISDTSSEASRFIPERELEYSVYGKEDVLAGFVSALFRQLEESKKTVN